MTSRNPQPEGAPIELSEETRLQRCELILQLVAVIAGILAAVAQALLRSEDLNLAQKAGLRLMQAGLAPVVRRLEALAAAYREGLPETDERTPRAAGGAASAGASGSASALLHPLLEPPPPPAPRPAAASPPAVPTPRGQILVRPRAGPSPPMARIAKAAWQSACKHAHIVATS